MDKILWLFQIKLFGMFSNPYSHPPKFPTHDQYFLIEYLYTRKSFRTDKIPNDKESRNRNFFRAEITTFSLPNQTMARLTLNSAKL